MKELAYPHAIRDIVSEYRYKSENLLSEMQTFEDARERLNANSVVSIAQGAQLARNQYISHEIAQRQLLKSAWRALYIRLNLDRVFSASDNKLFDQSLESPPELTLENLKATFGDYYENPRYYILKGLAEVFCKLDKFYKSHTNFGVGVKGLPKRVILNNFLDGRWGKEALVDVCRAMLQVTGESALKDEEREQISRGSYSHQDFELERIGLKIKIFGNGNAHAHFSPRALNTVNLALHEFYGEVLADEAGEKPDKKQTSTDVSKDLQFYPTPRKVIDRVLSSINITKDDRVLEPSCGDGAILDALAENGIHANGIEYDAGRARQARAKGHSAQVANFLECEPDPRFDYVIMNPPFAGQHYVKHVEHAMKFLRAGGILIAILPANAWYKHKKLKGRWTDLPMCSFRESGTNVNTGFITIRN